RGFLGEGQEVGGVGPAQGRRLAGGGQALQGVLADGLQQAQAGLPPRPFVGPPGGLVPQGAPPLPRPPPHPRPPRPAPPPPPPTATAAARAQPPPKTARRRKRARSSGVSRSSLQAIVARRVCCRAGRSRGPRLSRGRRRPRRASRAPGGSSGRRAAASSRARG